MISREDVETAVHDVQTFVDESVEPGHPARIEWDRAKSWLLVVLQNLHEAR